MGDVRDENAVVILAVYSVKEEGEEALQRLRELAKVSNGSLIEGATVYKNFDGKIYVTDTAAFQPAAHHTAGAAIGGLIGLAFPPSIVVGAAGSGTVGSLYGNPRDRGMSDGDLEAAGANVHPGECGLIVLLIESFADLVKAELAQCTSLTVFQVSAEVFAIVLGGREADGGEVPSHKADG